MSIIKGSQADWGVIAPQGLLFVLLLCRYSFALVAGLEPLRIFNLILEIISVFSLCSAFYRWG